MVHGSYLAHQAISFGSSGLTISSILAEVTLFASWGLSAIRWWPCLIGVGSNLTPGEAVAAVAGLEALGCLGLNRLPWPFADY